MTFNDSKSGIKSQPLSSGMTHASLTITLSPGGGQITMAFSSMIGFGLSLTDLSGVPHGQVSAWTSIGKEIAQQLAAGNNLGGASVSLPSALAMLSPSGRAVTTKGVSGN